MVKNPKENFRKRNVVNINSVLLHQVCLKNISDKIIKKKFISVEKDFKSIPNALNCQITCTSVKTGNIFSKKL